MGALGATEAIGVTMSHCRTARDRGSQGARLA